MRRSLTLAGLSTLAAGLAIALPADPAAAAVTTVRSGNAITVTATGDVSVGFTCIAGNVSVSGTAVTPSLPCASLSDVTVNGDAGKQVVYGTDLDAAAFAAHPALTASLGDGVDGVMATKQADWINMGPGDDWLTVFAGGAADSSLQLGADSDFFEVYGTTGPDTITVTSGSANAAIAWSSGAESQTYQAQNSDILRIWGRAGNDTISSTGLVAASTIDRIDSFGEEGDDTISNGTVTGNLGGGDGTNTINGGAAAEVIDSNSDTDVLHLGGGSNYVYDRYGLRSGGRTIDVTSPDNWYFLSLDGNDATWRLRPGTGGNLARSTASLTRPGIQDLPTGMTSIGVDFGGFTAVGDRALADLVLPAGTDLLSVYGDAADDDILDITVPAGSWSTSGSFSTHAELSPSDTSLPHVWIDNFGAVSIHGPWTNPARGFVHRAQRDLLFRFPTSTDLDEGQAFLEAGTLTRAQVTASFMDTDEYRGLDVDRVFVKYLRRGADPSGRTYWINRLREGRALWRFRAQLFGGNEYFNKAGGTNAAYVERAYNDVLGRSPDPSGKTFWTNKLNNGADRGSVALQFLNSPEARRRLVDDQFLRFLDRKPTTAEQTSWVAQIPSNDGEQRLIAFLVNSNAYYARS